MSGLGVLRPLAYRTHSPKQPSATPPPSSVDFKWPQTLLTPVLISQFDPLPNNPLPHLYEPCLRLPAPRLRGPQPLAERMRPRTLDELYRQEKFLGPGKHLCADRTEQSSTMLLWAAAGAARPRGATICPPHQKSEFIHLAAVHQRASRNKRSDGRSEKKSAPALRTIVFAMKSRFNKIPAGCPCPRRKPGPNHFHRALHEISVGLFRALRTGLCLEAKQRLKIA